MYFIYSYSQAVLQSPFSNGSSPTPETLGGAETRFTYVPATVGDGTIATADGTNLTSVAAAGGEGKFFFFTGSKGAEGGVTPNIARQNPFFFCSRKVRLGG